MNPFVYPPLRLQTLFRRSLFFSFIFVFGSALVPVYAQQAKPAKTDKPSTPAPAAAAPSIPSGPSLLSNGKFEKDSGKNWPADWPQPEGATWEQEEGTRFIRLSFVRPDQMIMAHRQIVLPPDRPAVLELRVRARANDLKAGKSPWFDGRVMTQFKDKAGTVLKKKPGAPNFKGTSKGWQDKSVFFEVPPEAHVLEVMPTLFRVNGGSLDLAEVDIFPARADQLPPPPPMEPSATVVPPASPTLSKELHVVGNQLQDSSGKHVWLQGLCVDSMQWGMGEHIKETLPVALDQWHAKILRLPVTEEFWFGWKGKKDKGMTYRALVDTVVEAAATRGAYVALDLHRFGAPTEKHVAFWKDAATRYKNHPAVLFELFNEPHSISWKTWRYGGNLKDPENVSGDVNPKENNEKVDGDQTPGMQALVDAVRSTGAKNVVIAGGLDWGYDLSGVAAEYALQDNEGGNGIVYSSHIYPWKKDWEPKMLAAAAKYPIFIGEVGCPPDWNGFKFIPENQRYEKLGPECEWPSDMIGLIQKHKLNWTGFSFHPKCGPMVILDWQYTPTPYWGTFVKEALAGKQYELKRMR